MKIPTKQPLAKAIRSSKPTRNINYGSSSTNPITGKKRPAENDMDSYIRADDMERMLYQDGPYTISIGVSDDRSHNDRRPSQLLLSEEGGYTNMLNVPDERRGLVHPAQNVRRPPQQLPPGALRSRLHQQLSSKARGPCSKSAPVPRASDHTRRGDLGHQDMRGVSDSMLNDEVHDETIVLQHLPVQNELNDPAAVENEGHMEDHDEDDVCNDVDNDGHLQDHIEVDDFNDADNDGHMEEHNDVDDVDINRYMSDDGNLDDDSNTVEDNDRTTGSRSVAQGNVVNGVISKEKLEIVHGRIAPNKAVRDLGVRIKTNWPGAYAWWRDVPDDPKKKIWDAFTAIWEVPPDREAIVKKAFEVSANDLYRAALNRARRDALKMCQTTKIAECAKGCPFWIHPTDWTALLRIFASPEWQKVSTKNRQNRMTEKDGCIPKHTGGSITHEEHADRMTKALGRVPAFPEVFLRVHQSRKGQQPGQRVFVDSRAQLVYESYIVLMKAKYGETWTNTSPIFDIEVWKQALGGYTKGRMYGVGNPEDHDRGAWRTSPEDRLYTRTEVVAMIDERVATGIAEGMAAERQRLIAEVTAEVTAAVRRDLGIQMAEALINHGPAAPGTG